MPKLNESIRSKIAAAALADAFADREDALVKRENDLARKVLADALGSKTMKLLAGLPDGIVPTNKTIIAQFATSYIELDAGEWLRVPSSKRGHRATSCLKVYEAGDPLSIEYDEMANDKKTVAEDKAKLKATLGALLSSVTTTEKLLLAWPDGEKYIPNIVVPVRTLPAVLAKDISAMIDASKEAA